MMSGVINTFMMAGSIWHITILCQTMLNLTHQKHLYEYKRQTGKHLPLAVQANPFEQVSFVSPAFQRLVAGRWSSRRSPAW